MISVAFQGAPGAYSEEAVRRYFRGSAEAVPCREFAEVGEAVVSGRTEYGMLPVENTLAGSVVPSYDVLAAAELEIVGEVVLPIHHCVLGIPGATLEGLTRVISHPVALAQCTRFLRSRDGLRAEAVYDTAGAAQEVARLADPGTAAVAGRWVAGRYGLELLAADIEDRSDNQTRFLLVTCAGGERPELPASEPAPRAAMRTTLMVELRNEPGSLVSILLPFAERGISLSKIESRPTGDPWAYRFFADIEADLDTAAGALDEVRARAERFRILGSYPRAAGP